MCYRYTIPHKSLILHLFLSKLLQMASQIGPDHITAPVVSVQPSLNRPRNCLHLTVFVGFAAFSSDIALFFPLADSDQRRSLLTSAPSGPCSATHSVTGDLLDRLALDEVLAPNPRTVSTISIPDHLLPSKAANSVSSEPGAAQFTPPTREIASLTNQANEHVCRSLRLNVQVAALVAIA